MKILIIRLSSIGDILLSTAFIRQTRQAFPEAEINFIIKKRFSDLIRFNPHIDNIFEYDDEKQTRPSEFVKLFKSIEYDYIFDLHNNLRSIYIRNKINAKNRFYIRKDKFAQTALVQFKWHLYTKLKSIPERYSDVGLKAGIADDGKGLEIFWNKETDSSLDNHFTGANIDGTIPSIGLAPGAGFYTKRWPVDYFKQLIDLINSRGDFNIILLGGEQETELGNQLDNFPNVYNFIAKLNILESGAAISKLSCLISNDSGLMHMATCVNTPVLAIFGSSVKEFGFFPYRAKGLVLENKDLDCRPCSHIGKTSCPRDHFKCMNDIRPEMIYNALKEII
jgi:heptosyltransferase-2